MGAWSYEAFGNDTASDWVYGLEDSPGLEILSETIEAALEMEDDYLEAPEAEEALAAIEVLVHLLGMGSPTEPLPKEVASWVKACKEKPGPELVQKAILALVAIQSEKLELRELWEESDDFQAWNTSIDQRIKALRET